MTKTSLAKMNDMFLDLFLGSVMSVLATGAQEGQTNSNIAAFFFVFQDKVFRKYASTDVHFAKPRSAMNKLNLCMRPLLCFH